MRRAKLRTSFPAQKNENEPPQRILQKTKHRGDHTGTEKKQRFLTMKYTPAKIYPDFIDKIDNLQQLFVQGKVTQEQFTLGYAAILQEALEVPKWHVEYRFRNPNTNKRERFKVYQDINRQQGQGKVEYAKRLQAAVNTRLMEGFDPFKAAYEVQMVTTKHAEKIKLQQQTDKSNYNIIQALNFFIKSKEKQGIADSTMDGYASSVRFFKNWLNEHDMLLAPAGSITDTQILSFLDEYAELEIPKSPIYPQGKRKWGNKAYNNQLNYIGIAFNFMAERPHRIIPESPLYDPQHRETFERKHTAYSDQQLTTLLKLVRNKRDKFMEGVILTVYYACIRSKAEIRALRAGNILYDRDLIRLDAEGTKGKRDDHIPLDPILKQFYIDQGYDKLQSDWFIFGSNSEPSPIQAGENYYAKKFRPYREEMGLSEVYTLYGFKHTRCIHLATAGISPYALIQLTRHKNLEELMAYLRNLGVSLNYDAVKNSREL